MVGLPPLRPTSWLQHPTSSGLPAFPVSLYSSIVQHPAIPFQSSRGRPERFITMLTTVFPFTKIQLIDPANKLQRFFPTTLIIPISRRKTRSRVLPSVRLVGGTRKWCFLFGKTESKFALLRHKAVVPSIVSALRTPLSLPCSAHQRRETSTRANLPCSWPWTVSCDAKDSPNRSIGTPSLISDALTATSSTPTHSQEYQSHVQFYHLLSTQTRERGPFSDARSLSPPTETCRFYRACLNIENPRCLLTVADQSHNRIPHFLTLSDLLLQRTSIHNPALSNNQQDSSRSRKMSFVHQSTDMFLRGDSETWDSEPLVARLCTILREVAEKGEVVKICENKQRGALPNMCVHSV